MSRLDEVRQRANNPFRTLTQGIAQVDEDRDYLLAEVDRLQSADSREPARFATTEEELDTLPAGTVVMTHTVWLRVRSAHGRLVWGCVGDTKVYGADIVMADTVATVLYQPKEES